MSEDTATATLEAPAVSEDIKSLGDQIAELTLKQAKELSDYLDNAYGIKPAAGGAVVQQVATSDAGEGGAEEQTEFDVVMTSFGAEKIKVVKVVKAITGASLMEAKKITEDLPATLKEKASQEEADKLKKDLEEAGATVELK